MTFSHEPVLLTQTIDLMQVKPDGCYIDGTVGGAGHATQIAYRLGEGGHLYGFDRDLDAVKASTERLAGFGDRVTIIHDNYKNALSVLREKGIREADGILLDLGVSSHQIDEASRGFSYMQDGPLDMRMDREEAISAKDIVATYPEGTLTQIFRDFGEERFARQIARRIVEEREDTPIETTFQLNEIIYRAVPKKARKEGSHPAKRVYQALRIACNRELEGLQETLQEMIAFLAPGGRLCVITFHSLEDRIVKQVFRTAEAPCICPPKSPVCVCGRVPSGKRLNRKAIRADETEIANNPRAKSAGLRGFIKEEERG